MLSSAQVLFINRKSCACVCVRHKTKTNHRIHRQIARTLWKWISFSPFSPSRSRALSLSVFVGVLYRSRQHFIYRWLRWKIRAREYEHRFLTSGIRGNVGNAMDGHKRMAVCVLLFRTLQTVNMDPYSYRNRKCGCSNTMSGSIGNDKWAFWILCHFIYAMFNGRGGVCTVEWS